MDAGPIIWPRGFEIDNVLLANEVFSAHDQTGCRYLVAHTTGRTWLCAPVTDRALACVASGRAELRDAFAHSSTGLVEQLTIQDATICDESVRLCRELTDDELPRRAMRLRPQTRCA